MNRPYSQDVKLLFLSIIIIFVYVSPLFILGESAHIRDHDNLDSNIAWYRVLINSGELLGDLDATIPQVLNGNLSRGAFGSEWSLIVWLHALFPPMVAYGLSQTITRIFAFIGMYVLLKTHFVKEPSAAVIRVGVSLAFALTPFWPSGMLSTMGHPLALWAFLNIRDRKKSWISWITIVLLPLYSSIVLGFFFFLVAVGLLWARDIVVRRDWNLRFLLSIILMTTFFLLVEYRLVYSLITPQELTHRIEFVSSRHGFLRSIRLSLKNFILGHHHVMTVHTFVILPLSIIALMKVVKFREWIKEKRFIVLMIVNLLLSIWYAFWFNKILIPVKEVFDITVTFNFARFHFLRPIIVYLIFALACVILWRWGSRWKKAIHTLLVIQVVILFLFNEEIIFRAWGTPSFKEYYATEQFMEIRDYIDSPQSSYRVVSIGIHPAIAQYNGFYTLDTYNNFYPLTYKDRFREIIKGELEKDAKLREYFDEWGSRCYVFVEELGKKYDYKKDSGKVVQNLKFNTQAFKRMGGEYVLSAVPIMNARENQLALVRTFHHHASAWTIYLYKAL